MWLSPFQDLTYALGEGASSGESNRPSTPILSKSIAIYFPFLSRYFCKKCAPLGRTWYIHHQFVSRYGSHLYRDALADVLGSGVVGTLPISGNRIAILNKGGGSKGGSGQKCSIQVPNFNTSSQVCQQHLSQACFSVAPAPVFQDSTSLSFDL